MIKEKYQLYELYNFADGNDDILSDIGSGEEVRQGMWAQVPYNVNDGQGYINERFVDFVTNRDYYPSRPLTVMPYLMEEFNKCTGNLKEVFKYSKEPKRFYENLLKLQEYLIKQNSYDGEPLSVLNEGDEPENLSVSKSIFALEDMSYAVDLANAIAKKLGMSAPRKNLGGGSKGVAFEMNDNLVMKITSDVSEADAAFKTMRNKPKTIADIYEVYKVVDTEKNLAFFVLFQENIQNKPTQLFWQYDKLIEKIKPMGMNMGDLWVMINRRGEKLLNNLDVVKDLPQHVLTDNPDAGVDEATRKKLSEFIQGILAIKMDLMNNNINSNDYSQYGNLGYKNGILTYFDVGDYRAEEPDINKDDIIYLPEGQEDLTEEYNRETADKIAAQVAQQKELGQPVYLDAGENGIAYDINNNLVLKITKDKSEAVENLSLIGKKLKYVAEIFHVFEVTSKSHEIPETYAIVLEKLETTPEIKRQYDRLDYAFNRIMGVEIPDVIEYYLGEWDDGKVSKDKINSYLKKNPRDAEFFGGLLRIAEETKDMGIESIDFLNPKNLGYKKNGALAFFDVGSGTDYVEPQGAEKVMVDEDGSAKFSTPNAVAQDDFPPYETNDTSPSIQNDLNANSAMYNEDLEYNHVQGDATEDQYMLDESKLKPIGGDKRSNVYFMSVEDDVFIHFAPKKEAVQIAKTKKLDPSFSDTFVDAVFAVSLTYGEFYPDIQIHNIGGNRSRDFNDYVAIVFKTNDKPKVGFASEVVWNGIVNLQIIKYLTVKGAMNQLSNTQYKIGENDYVLYDEKRIQHIDEERNKSFGTGSKTVSVKKKCKLGGLGNTSAACNQGDINNLEFGSINEVLFGEYRGKEIYVNPPTIRKLASDSRGFVDTDGNLYMIDDGWNLTHSALMFPLLAKGVITDPNDVTYYYKSSKGIAVQRVGITNYLAMSDAYRGNAENKFNEFKSAIDKAKIKNPRIKFIGIQYTDAEEQLKSNSLINEEIDASEAYSEEGALETILNGKRDVALLRLYEPQIDDAVNQAGLNIIPIKQNNHPESLKTSIVYRDGFERQAKRLYDIMVSHGGYVSDQTPEEAREIGKILGYTDVSIEGYIRRTYPEKMSPIESSPDDYQDFDEGMNSQTKTNLNEYREQMEKVYGRTGIYDKEDMDVILSITGGDPYTKWIADIYYYLANRYNKESVKPTRLSERDREILIDAYERIKRYDKNVLPIHDLYAQEHNAHPLEKMNDLRMRELIVGKLKQLPSVLLRNLRADIRKEREHYELEHLFQTVKEIQNLLGLLEKVKPENREKIYKKVFSSANDTFDDIKKRLDDTTIPYLSQDLGVEDIVEKVDDMGDEAEILYKQNDILVVKIMSAEAMGYVGCSSQWCFASDPNQYWDQYTREGFATIVFNFNEPESESNRMVVVLEDGSVYNMYNDYMEDGDEYLSDIGVSEIINQNIENYAEIDENFTNIARMNEIEIMSLQDLPFKQEVEQRGGKIYSVGGAVRDEILGKDSKDLDVLITGIPLDELQQILDKYGRVSLEGESFGVLKFKPQGATEDIDIAIPRTDKATGGGGHKDIETTSDHELPLEKDLERRDITINAMAKDVDGNIIDPYGGQEDLKNKTIRAVNPDAFNDDPLRMLRAVQFASRFGFEIEPQTMQMIKDTASAIKKIAPERILTEFEKIITKGNPRIGVELLVATGLFKQIFGNQITPSQIGRRNFEGVKTMAEFLFLMMDGVVQNPAEFFLHRFVTEKAKKAKIYKEMQALDLAFNSDLVRQEITPVNARSVASNMFKVAQQTLESQILPEQIENAAHELLQGKYPKTVDELAINGNDLMELGLYGEAIRDMKKSLLINVYSNKVRNNREDLLSLAKGNAPIVKEYLSYNNPTSTWDINGKQVEINFFVEKYDEWNYEYERFRDASRESVSRFIEDVFPEFVDDDKLKRELYWALTDRDLLNENVVKNIAYSAVVLTDESHAKLLKVFGSMIPKGWKPYAHHMTLNMGNIDPKYVDDLGKEVELTVVDYAIDDLVMAVGVEGYPTNNAKPHITLAVNIEDGGKPFFSNKLTDWKPIGFPLKVTGIITEVPR